MRTWVKMVFIGCVVGLVMSGVACSTGQSPSASQTPSLYDRLGGKPAITAVVDEFVGNVAKDARINGRFLL